MMISIHQLFAFSCALLVTPTNSFGISSTASQLKFEQRLTHPLRLQAYEEDGNVFDDSKSCSEEEPIITRRNFFDASVTAAATAALFLSVNPSPTLAADFTGNKVLVLGGSGFVGSEVCKQLQALGVDYISTSRDGRDGTVAFDALKSGIDVGAEIEQLSKGCTAVISCIGAIGTSNDGVVNSATGLAAIGAVKADNVKNFVYISVAPEVRESASGLAFLSEYMEGKSFSEESIKKSFSSDGRSFTLIEPTFIYGGDKFAVNPPRVADGYGKLVEGLLSSAPFRAAASISPGIIGVALEPPVKVSAVSKAAVAGALGLSKSVLDTYDKINDAASLL